MRIFLTGLYLNSSCPVLIALFLCLRPVLCQKTSCYSFIRKFICKTDTVNRVGFMISLRHMGECVVYNRKKYVALMKSTQKMTAKELKTLADKYDSVYLHPVSGLITSLHQSCVYYSTSNVSVFISILYLP